MFDSAGIFAILSKILLGSCYQRPNSDCYYSFNLDGCKFHCFFSFKTNKFIIGKVNTLHPPTYQARQSTFLIGSLISLGGLVLMFLMPVKLWYLVFIVAVLLGAGTATVTICAANFQVISKD